MSSEESDAELQSALPKSVPKKGDKSRPEEQSDKKEDMKKLTTKDMIHQALTELKSRKGTSLYAIKKYIQEKYQVDVEKLNYVIKKAVKTSVEAGIIVQTKGVGASGSFKLAPGKNKPDKSTSKKKEIKQNVDKPTKPPKTVKTNKTKESKSNENIEGQKKPKKKVEMTKSAASAEKKEKNKKVKEQVVVNETKIKKLKAVKAAKGLQTPAKKRSAMMKRKSIGSIIKPPKMNPKKG